MLALLGRRNHVWERIYVPASGWVVASSPGINLCSACSASQPCMGRFLAYSLCTSYEAKTFKMNKKNSSENYFRFWKSYAVIMKQILRKRSALLCVQTCVCVYLQNNKKRAKAKTCEGFFFFCEESGCVHCRVAKFAEMILLWTRMRPRLWKLPLEVTVL